MFMKLKGNIAGGILLFFIIGIIIVGIIMFRGIDRDKQVLSTDLYNYLPVDVSGILQINNEKSVTAFQPYIQEELNSVVSGLQSSLSYPVLFANYDSSMYLLAKVTDNQQNIIKDILSNGIFPHYPPKERFYKDARILFYVTENDGFFVCMFYQDVFVGGYGLKLLEDIVNIGTSDVLSVSDTPIGKKIVSDLKGHYPANLFVNNTSSFSVLNINFDGNQIKMKGYDTGIFADEWSCGSSDSDYMEIDFPVFPDKLIAYEVNWKNSMVNDSLGCYFSAPSYTFYIKENMLPVYALKHLKDKYFIYNMLNNLEEKYIQKRFDTNDYTAGYRIYTTSDRMGADVFKSEGKVFLTFINDCMVFSKDRKSLENYLLGNGNFVTDQNPFEYIDLDSEVISLFYTNDISKKSTEFFNSQNPLVNHQEAYIFSSLNNKKREFEIHLKK